MNNSRCFFQDILFKFYKMPLKRWANGCNFANYGAEYDFLGVDSLRAGQHDPVLVFGGYGGHGDRRPVGNLT